MCSWVEKLTKVEKSILPKLIYKFNTIPIKISARFLCKQEYSQIYMKKTDNFEKIMTWEESILDIEAYYTATVIGTVLLVERQTRKSMDQREPRNQPTQAQPTDL